MAVSAQSPALEVQKALRQSCKHGPVLFGVQGGLWMALICIKQDVLSSERFKILKVCAHLVNGALSSEALVFRQTRAGETKLDPRA